jgi:hypothetical protein
MKLSPSHTGRVATGTAIFVAGPSPLPRLLHKKKTKGFQKAPAAALNRLHGHGGNVHD